MNEKKEGAFIKALKKVEDKGFYIILSLCVIAIGVSGYVLFINNDTETVLNGEQENLWSIDDVFKDTEPKEDDYRPTPPEIKLPENPVSHDEPEEKPEQKEVANLPKAMLPTAGEVIREYSGNTLIYDKTMCDFRTHNGTDFACTQGDSIFCIRDGVVTDVYEDGLLGWTVKVSHSDDVVSTYSGLSGGLSLKAGDELKMGDAVGTAGGTAIGEINEPYHVHVSVTQNGKYIDVLSLFE